MANKEKAILHDIAEIPNGILALVESNKKTASNISKMVASLAKEQVSLVRYAIEKYFNKK